MKRAIAAFAFAAMMAAGCRAQIPPATNYQVNLTWTAPQASASWTGCTTAAPCVYAVYRAATLVSGTATVSTTAACIPGSTCIYTLTRCGAGASTAIGSLAVGTTTAGTSFVINSLSSTAGVVSGDTSVVCWRIN